MTVYTLGFWTVQEGREDDFIRAWTDMGERTKQDFPAVVGTLLRDRDQPNLFVSYGPWASLEEVAAWRSSEAFTQGVTRIRELLMNFEPHTMELAARVV